MKILFPLFLLLLLIASSCQNDAPASKSVQQAPQSIAAPGDTDRVKAPASDAKAAAPEERKNSLPVPAPKPAAPVTQTPAPAHTIAPARIPADSGFTELTTLDASIRLDIRYATTNNFTKAKIYDCPRCLLRPEAAEAIEKAHKLLQKKGLGLKMFDCYRPRPYQQRLWDKVPNPDYVTPPAKGSMHSRGVAVDLTIVDAKGNELEMGTPYDFFGEAAHTDYTKLPANVLENRRLLRETLESVGFKGIRTEWWHFSYQKQEFPLSSYVWPCRK